MSAKRLPRPKLYCPFVSVINIHRDEAETKNLEWLRRFGLLASPDIEQRARRARFAWLAARAYPSASMNGLMLAVKWASWLFMRDDVCDEAGIRSDPQAMCAHSESLLGVLTGIGACADADPLARSLADLRLAMIARGGARWMSRFIHNVQEYFEACSWEADNRRRGAAPDIASYQRMRDLTGAVRTCFDMHELAEGTQLPVEARYDPILSRMMQATNRVICFSNDIFSVDKELEHADCHNLVIVLHRTKGMSLEEAVFTAAHMHDSEVETFLSLERALVGRLSKPRGAEPFISALKGWMRANLDWSLETGRYAVAAGQHDQLSASHGS